MRSNPRVGMRLFMIRDDKFELGRLRGVPVLVDPAFVLVILAAIYPFLASSEPRAASMALLVAAGLIASILLRAMARMAAAQLYGPKPELIELTGLGDHCRFSGCTPVLPQARIAIMVAGPAASIALWVIFSTFWRETHDLAALTSDASLIPGLTRLAEVLWFLAQANLFAFALSLLPALPLDGGRALRRLAAIHLGQASAHRLVARTGYAVAGLVAVGAYFLGPFMLLLAALLTLESVAAGEPTGGPPRRAP